MTIELSLAAAATPRTLPLLSGEIAPKGVRLVARTELHGPALFRHQLQTGEFDVSEMSLTTVYARAVDGDERFLALPVFPMRGVFHTSTLVREGRVARPEDLAGKRIGVPNHASAAAVWARGALQDDFCLDLSQVRWFASTVATPGVQESAAGRPLSLPVTPLASDRRPEDLLVAGDLDAAMNLGKRGIDLVGEQPAVRWLFADRLREAQRYYCASGFLPINHCLVIRRELVEQHPFLPAAIFEAFLEANRRASQEHPARLELEGAGEIELDEETLAHGIEPQRRALEAFARHCHRQGLVDKLLTPESVFGGEDRNPAVS